VSAALLIASLLLLAACSGSPGEQAAKLRQKQQSWESTERLTTELSQKGALPAEYVRQALEAARQELDKARRDAERLSP
jgi:hypothetical protein